MIDKLCMLNLKVNLSIQIFNLVITFRLAFYNNYSVFFYY